MTTLPRLVRERNVTAKIRPVSRSGVTLAKRVAPASTLSLSHQGSQGWTGDPSRGICDSFAALIMLVCTSELTVRPATVPILKRLTRK